VLRSQHNGSLRLGFLDINKMILVTCMRYFKGTWTCSQSESCDAVQCGTSPAMFRRGKSGEQAVQPEQRSLQTLADYQTRRRHIARGSTLHTLTSSYLQAHRTAMTTSEHQHDNTHARTGGIKASRAPMRRLCYSRLNRSESRRVWGSCGGGCGFWDVAPSRYCENRRFGGSCRLHIQGRKNCERGTGLTVS
jgi:hypothetical protein